jgi:hypothetical protein
VSGFFLPVIYGTMFAPPIIVGLLLLVRGQAWTRALLAVLLIWAVHTVLFLPTVVLMSFVGSGENPMIILYPIVVAAFWLEMLRRRKKKSAQ